MRDQVLAACWKVLIRVASSLADSFVTQALDQAGVVEGRKPGHFSQAFSKWNRHDFAVEVGRLRIRGMWSEVEPMREVRQALGNMAARALLMNARSSLAKVGESLLLDQVYRRSRSGSSIRESLSTALLNLSASLIKVDSVLVHW